MKEAGDPLSMQVLSVASWGNAHIRYRSSSQSNHNRHIDICCVYQGSTFETTITCGSSAIMVRGVNGQGGHILIVTSISISAHHSPPIRQPTYPTGSYVAPVKLTAFARTPREDDDKVIINLLYGSAQQVSAAPQDSARGN